MGPRRSLKAQSIHVIIITFSARMMTLLLGMCFHMPSGDRVMLPLDNHHLMLTGLRMLMPMRPMRLHHRLCCIHHCSLMPVMCSSLALGPVLSAHLFISSRLLWKRSCYDTSLRLRTGCFRNGWRLTYRTLRFGKNLDPGLRTGRFRNGWRLTYRTLRFGKNLDPGLRTGRFRNRRLPVGWLPGYGTPASPALQMGKRFCRRCLLELGLSLLPRFLRRMNMPECSGMCVQGRLARTDNLHAAIRSDERIRSITIGNGNHTPPCGLHVRPRIILDMGWNGFAYGHHALTGPITLPDIFPDTHALAIIELLPEIRIKLWSRLLPFLNKIPVRPADILKAGHRLRLTRPDIPLLGKNRHCAQLHSPDTLRSLAPGIWHVRIAKRIDRTAQMPVQTRAADRKTGTPHRKEGHDSAYPL